MSISKTMSGQILIHAGHTSRLLRIIWSSERRGRFSGVLRGLSSTSSTSDCCREKISLLIQTNHTHLLWHFYTKDTSAFVSDPHSRSDFSISALRLTVSHSVLCFSYSRSVMLPQRHHTNQLWITWGRLSDL